MKLKNKFLIIFLLLSALPIFVISLFTYNRYTYLINRQMEQLAENMVRNATDELNGTLHNMQKMTDLLFFDSVTNELHKYNDASDEYTSYDIMTSNNNIKDICQNIIYTYDYINGVFLFTPKGVILGYGYGNGIDIRTDYTPSEDTWYQETIEKKGRLLIGDLSLKDFMLGVIRPSISFSKAIYDVYTREFLGVLFIDCSPKVFDLSNINTLPQTAALMVRNHDSIYYNDAKEETLFMNSDTSWNYERTLDFHDVTLSATFNYESLYAEFDDTAHMLIFFVIISTLLFAAIAILLSNSLSKPIIYLSDKMATREGNHKLNGERYLNRTDEIGVLYNEYQRYTDELDHYINRELQNKLITLDSQMKSLEAQINSHFLYNTLASINSIAELEEVESVAIMSQALGDMFRYSIKTKSELVTISEELKHVKDYYAIQSIRFDNRFQLLVEIPADMLALKILKLILQPILENALYHGLQRCSIGGTIRIKGTQDACNILLSVSDDGIGMDEDKLYEITAMLQEKPQFTELGQRNKESIGIKNIDTRIKLYYGQHYGLVMESTKGFGTTTTIKVPINS